MYLQIQKQLINLYYRAQSNIPYTINHWKQNLTGSASLHDDTNYTLEDTENFTGETNTQVIPNTIAYAGFTGMVFTKDGTDSNKTGDIRKGCRRDRLHPLSHTPNPPP